MLILIFLEQKVTIERSFMSVSYEFIVMHPEVKPCLDFMRIIQGVPLLDILGPAQILFTIWGTLANNNNVL